MINKLDGKIAFDSFSLTPNITLQAFKSLLKSNQIVSHEENEMAINIYLLPQKCGDKYFSINTSLDFITKKCFYSILDKLVRKRPIGSKKGKRFLVIRRDWRYSTI